MSGTIALGIRSSEGRARLTISSMASGPTLKTEIRKLLKLDVDFEVKKDKMGRPGDALNLTRSTSRVSTSLGLKNGDVLHVKPLEGVRFSALENSDAEMAQPSTSGAIHRASSNSSLASSTNTSTSNSAGNSKKALQEDAVDVQLSKMDGLIYPDKSKSSKRGMSLDDLPIDPFDAEHLKKIGVKFLSFHSYLKKMTQGSKFAALDDISLRIKEGCSKGCVWPQAICSQCQPPALTLNRQSYRHVDHIEFENADIVDNFLAFWRVTGGQRIGFLYGRYEQFPGVPLGIKAVVSAIYEPPQEGTRDGVKLEPAQPETEAELAALASNLGLQRVGWMFTDLIPSSDGQVKHFRNIDTYFLSSQECITAGHYQNLHPNVTKKASSGKHGSKFVTVVVTGDKDNLVHMEGYQVSNQCMALVRENVLLPTRDAPELGFVKESGQKQYVPDVFYKLKDEYGNEVTKVARPLPVEYLLIDVPVATPNTPVLKFNSKGFPTENRPMEGHLQDFPALASLRQKYSNHQQLPEFFKDFHLLLYLATQTVHPLDRGTMAPLLKAIRDGKDEEIYQWAESSHWHTLEALIQNFNDGFV